MQNDMRDRLIDLIKQSHCVDVWDCYNDDFIHPNPIETLADHLIANGVIVPPCKVGDTVYYLDGKTIVKDVVHCISFGGRHGVNAKGFIHMHDSDKDNVTANFSLFGDKVFLTKDRAEEKLKEMRVDNGNL